MGKITNAEVEALIQPTRGNMASIARHLGVTRSAISLRVSKSENLTKLIEEARESMLDDAESSLYKQVLAGNTAALIFFLKTQGHRRGYTEKQQIEHSGQLDINVSELSDEELERIISSASHGSGGAGAA